MNIREEQKEKRRNEILNAGMDLFIRKGYYATKVSDIADQVGMSVGLLFHYFASKEKLYEELISLGISGPMSIMAHTEKEPLAFFEDITRQIFHYIKAEPFTAKMFILMSRAFYNEATPDCVKEMLASFNIYKPTSELILKGQKGGTIRSGDPYALSIAFWSAVRGIAEEIALNPNSPCPNSDWIIDIIRR
ncbi:TetR/AcrR family transcriptional regulator [Proteiniborus sp. MB09-C3]|uniref:TetR/AcrR family transcriptional regulator n=1 Tax=Proteiniborus sp. MB09-C3 TaxID=3050072 RepID=UPI002555588A|nr:TetR/AcrR family transcriptional regulator [Proteiniborus sp. MB09-C3]WIV11880.1 TetR/AcrR family transcriptional regulator [Proteiniborus sp. MB09-C3]